MKALKKISIIIAVALVLMLFADSFIVTALKDRAIVLGMGIDYENDEFNIICEVISSSQSSSQSSEGGSGGGFTKLVTGKGKTISLAVYDVYAKTGKLPSLGQCGVIILGESLYKEESLVQCLSYFLQSDAYRDSSLVTCCKGSAKDLYTKVTPLDTSVSFAVQTIITGSEHNTSIPYSYMARFISLQLTPSASDYLTVISFDSEKETTGGGDNKDTGFFIADDVAIFRDFKFVEELSEDETKGLTLLNVPASFDTFVVNDLEATQSLPKTVGIGIRSKKVKKELNFNENGKITYDVKIYVRAERMRTDTTGDVISFIPKEKSELTDFMQKQLRQQITDSVFAAFSKLTETNCDYLGISNEYYRKYGKKWVRFQQGFENVFEKIRFSVEVIIDK
ncbi:MAG TPA: Ger(x)C family spore germination C-terminal domain-containing protein [Eubacteriales bacterium]|nr:Ger(x)C family spore germination C-terminal domain-containing protein [Eubacteriales bacterium]